MYNVACVHALMGEIERALDLLERMDEKARGYRGWIDRDADLAALHGEPRFEALVERCRREACS